MHQNTRVRGHYARFICFMGDNITVKYNYVKGAVNGVAVKNHSRAYTNNTGGVFYNEFKNCQSFLNMKGANNVRFCNNTCWSDTVFMQKE